TVDSRNGLQQNAHGVCRRSVSAAAVHTDRPVAVQAGRGPPSRSALGCLCLRHTTTELTCLRRIALYYTAFPWQRITAPVATRGPSHGRRGNCSRLDDSCSALHEGYS